MKTQEDTSTEAIVFIVDDDPSVRKALTRMFESHEIQVKTFESGQDFFNFRRPDVAGCLLLDVNMPGQTGIELQEQLVTNRVDLPIIFMTGHGDIPMTVKAMRNGAIDFLTKPVDDEKLTDAVRRAIERHAKDRLEMAELKGFRERVETLTKREFEVMTYVIAGKLNKQIAIQMGITEYTVKVHRGRVMEKTGVDSVAELVRSCEKAGILSPEENGNS